MGGLVSTGRDNDELVDNLIDADCIQSKSVENVFRSVDRGTYYTETHRTSAYADSAWRDEHTGIHLSAPSIYAKVMEALNLKSGLSFLNMGSGTGYVSTMVGLLLGSSATSCNHGVEYRSEPIAHAQKKLAEFILESPSFDEYEFCVPQFIQGNCLKICTTKRYDRIYCGAECSDEVVEFVKSLLEIGGIAVVPATNRLVQITRTGESEYSTDILASVTFAELLPPAADDCDVELPEMEVPCLKALCRTYIRRMFRDEQHRSLGYLLPKKLAERRLPDPRLQQLNRLQVLAAAIMDDTDSENSSSDDETERRVNEDINDMEDIEEDNDRQFNQSDDSTSTNSSSSSELSDIEPMETVTQGNESFDDPLSINSSGEEIQEGTTPSTSQSAIDNVDSISASTKLGDLHVDSGIDGGSAVSSHSSAAASEDSPAGTDAAMFKPATVSDVNSESASPSRHGVEEEAASSNEEHVRAHEISSSESSSEDSLESYREHIPHSRRGSSRHTGLSSSAKANQSCETEMERHANREKAREYHAKFSATMCESIMSLPIPVTLKDYLLFYRRHPN